MPLLDREEYVEQAHFFRALRERVEQNEPTQQVLADLREEILATTKLPLAIDFLLGELRHAGAVSDGMARLGHYFSAFQTFLVERAEKDRGKFDLRIAYEVLEKEAEYRSQSPTAAGLFLFQFEALSRNRLGYDDGMQAIAKDPFFDDDWRDWILKTRLAVGAVDVCDLLYYRSAQFVEDRKRTMPDYRATSVVLFGRQEGRIARAHKGKDPLYFFAALQRQLGYPVVPKATPAAEGLQLPLLLELRLSRIEKRLQLLEAENSGKVDLTEFYAHPPDFSKFDLPDDPPSH